MANPYFNAVYYLLQNPDVLAAGYTADTAWNHYVNYGANEGNIVGGIARAPNPWFDIKYYLTNNPDLLAANYTPAMALDHFAKYGMAEGRYPNATIAANPITEASLLAYAMANVDLRQAFGISDSATQLTKAQQDQLTSHFYKNGYDEGRADLPTVVNVPQPNAGDTFTLTTSVDNFTGTSGNDTFVGDNLTSSAADQLNGGAGTDTLKLYNTSGNPVLPTISNIENIYIKGATADYNVSTLADVVSLEIDTVDVTGARAYTLATGQSLTLTNVTDIGNTGNDVDVNAAASVTAQTLKLNKVGDIAAAGVDVEIDINGAGVATLNLEATGAASKVTLFNSGTALKTLNVSGNQDLTILDAPNATTIAVTNTAKTAVTTSVAEVAVTGADGAETITLGHAAAANEFSVKTGAGNDKIVLSTLATAASLTDDKVTLSGGEGTDTLVITSALGKVLGALSATAFAKKGIANDFEILEISDQGAAADNVNIARLGSNITTVDYAAGLGAAQTLGGLASNGTVVLGAAASAATDALTVTVKDADVAGHNADVLNIKLDGLHVAAGMDYGVVNVANVETININSTTTKTTALVVANQNTVDLVAANATTVNVTGNVFADLSGAALTSAALSTVDASGNTAGVSVSIAGLTQGVVIKGTAKADTIVGGAGADDISGGAGKDTITGGAGNDKLSGGADSDTFKLGTNAAAIGKDTISDFTVGAVASGGDILTVTDITGLTTTTISAALTNVTGAQAIADNSIYTLNFNAAIDGKDFGGADFAELFAASGKAFSTTVAAATDSFIVVQGTDETQIYLVNSGATATTLTNAHVDQIIELTGVTNAHTFVDANFA